MKFFVYFIVLLFGLTAAAPPTRDKNKNSGYPLVVHLRSLSGYDLTRESNNKIQDRSQKLPDNVDGNAVVKRSDSPSSENKTPSLPNEHNQGALPPGFNVDSYSAYPYAYQPDYVYGYNGYHGYGYGY